MEHLKRLNLLFEKMDQKPSASPKVKGTLKNRPIKKLEFISKTEETIIPSDVVENSKSTNLEIIQPLAPSKIEKAIANTIDEKYISIKDWSEDDKPREKMRLKGKHALSNAELIAILIGSGSKSLSAVDLAKQILKSADNNLNELGKVSIDELINNFHGVGEAKAVTIAAALELGRRRQMTEIKEKIEVRSSQDAFNAIAPILMDLQHEEFWVLMLNRANQVLKRVQVSQGGIAGTVVDAKIIFKKALEIPASGMILCHNHPSGNLRPSTPDIEITKKIKQGAQLLDISVLDHLIVSERGYFSFADEGML